jgi:hypothetical protein
VEQVLAKHPIDPLKKKKGKMRQEQVNGRERVSIYQGHSFRKRRATSKVAPPHISRLDENHWMLKKKIATRKRRKTKGEKNT